MVYLFYDLETTGLHYSQIQKGKPNSISKLGAEVISIGGLFVDASMKPLSGFCHFCDILSPSCPTEAFQKHKISLKDVRHVLSGVFFDEVVIRHIPEMFSDDITFFGYNVITYDLPHTKECLVDAPLEFTIPKPVATIIPSKGRNVVDIMRLYGSPYPRLENISSKLNKEREEFFMQTKDMPFYTNHRKLYFAGGKQYHNAYYDSVNTYLLFMRDHFGKKVFV